jgi:hypothetical protein
MENMDRDVRTTVQISHPRACLAARRYWDFSVNEYWYFFILIFSVWVGPIYFQPFSVGLLLHLLSSSSPARLSSGNQPGTAPVHAVYRVLLACEMKNVNMRHGYFTAAVIP